MTVRGIAQGNRETFEFMIEPFVSGGYRLDIKYSGDCHDNVTGSGVWPTVDKAKEIAETTANKLLLGAQVYWEDL